MNRWSPPSRSRAPRQGAVAIALAIAFVACSDSDHSQSVPKAALWQTMEMTIPDPVADENPFDEAGTTVTGEFLSPSGVTTVVDGFVSRDYERELVGGFEHRRPLSELQWKIRFTPTEPGRWKWRWTVHDESGEHSADWTDFEVSAADPSAHGFVRLSNRDPRYLELDDGKSLFVVGENMCWYDGRGTFAYDEWMARIVSQGCNYIRLWMPSWAFGLEWTERDGAVVSSSLGNYTERLDRAWQLDYVIDLARRNGVYVMLAIQNHGAFSLDSNSEWADNPYNAANGGPLGAPRDFFTDPVAKDLFKRRLRYLIARWGSATNLLSWELWNEVDLAQQPALTDLTAWHEEMAAAIRERDPYHHLISTSTSQADALNPGSPFSALWALDAIDFSQVHFYSFGGAASDFTQVFPRAVNRLRRYAKPILIAEAGVDFRGPAETIMADPDGEGFHDLLWAAPFAETFGSGMTWWWDNVVDPQQLYPHFGPLASLVADVDFPGEGFVSATRTAVAPDGHTLHQYSLTGHTTVLVWIKNAAHLWHSPDAAEIRDATVSLEGLTAGTWGGQWIDTRNGETQAVEVEVGDSLVNLPVPTFSRDIALRLGRR